MGQGHRSSRGAAGLILSLFGSALSSSLWLFASQGRLWPIAVDAALAGALSPVRTSPSSRSVRGRAARRSLALPRRVRHGGGLVLRRGVGGRRGARRSACVLVRARRNTRALRDLVHRSPLGGSPRFADRGAEIRPAPPFRALGRALSRTYAYAAVTSESSAQASQASKAGRKTVERRAGARYIITTPPCCGCRDEPLRPQRRQFFRGASGRGRSAFPERPPARTRLALRRHRRGSAMTGLGVLLMQAPAGMISRRRSADRGRSSPSRRSASASVTEPCPYSSSTGWRRRACSSCRGASQAFLTPSSPPSRLSLAGHDGLGRMLGKNVCGTTQARSRRLFFAMLAVSHLGTTSVFVAVSFGACLTALSCALIRPEELEAHAPIVTQPPGERTGARAAKAPSLMTLLRDKRVLVLIVATTLFHSANAPISSLVALYIKHLRGTLKSVGAMVLLGQGVMTRSQRSPDVSATGSGANRSSRSRSSPYRFASSCARSPTNRPPGRHSRAGRHRRGHRSSGHRVHLRGPHQEPGRFNTLLGILATPMGA